MFNFDSKFFEKHQAKLLFIANKWYLRWLLGLNRLPKEIKGKRIDKITPNSIHHIIETKLTKKGKFKKEKITAEFFTRPRFAEALAYNLSPFCYFQELRSKRMVWRFSPAGLAYILLFGLAGKIAGLPLAFMGTTTSYYAGQGDGTVYNGGNTTSWANCHDTASGNSVDRTATADYIDAEQSIAGSWQIGRGYFPIDTSGLTSGVTISGATMNIRDANTSAGSNNLGLVQTFQASNTTLAVGDYEDCGSDNGTGGRAKYTCTEGATRVSSITAGQYFAFTLDATGLGWISKTGDTNLGVRMANDLDNTNPSAGRVYRLLYYSESTGTTNDPYLSVTYSASGPAKLKTWNELAAAKVKTINGLEIAKVKTINNLN